MTIPILETVLNALRTAGLRAELACPGQKWAALGESTAFVHLQQVDKGGATVAVEVLTPGELGGAACQREALRAMEALPEAECIQGECQLDGKLRAYRVTVLAAFAGAVGAEGFFPGPGFRVDIDGQWLPFAVSFTGARTVEAEPRYAMGETLPTEVDCGRSLWRIRLEEHIPVNVRTDAQAEPFDLCLERLCGSGELYQGCRWTSETRSYSREGLLRVREGIALEMEEAVYE